MKTKRSEPAIIAKNKEEFEKVSAALEKLPEQILSQIETARYMGGTRWCELTIKNGVQKVFLPNFTTQIENFGGRIGIYAKDYFFEIKERKTSPSYMLIDTAEWLESEK